MSTLDDAERDDTLRIVREAERAGIGSDPLAPLREKAKGKVQDAS